MHQLLISTGFVFGFAAVGLTAEDSGSKASYTDPSISTTELYSHYSACSRAAASRHLSEEEVTGCAAIYLQLKLSLLDGVTYGEYATLTSAERAQVNRAGYIAYRKWRESYLTRLN